MRLSLAIFMVLGLMLPGAAAAADWQKNQQREIPLGSMYRYVDAQGHTQISSTLTEEAIQQGYEILGPHGRVIRTVPPAPTEEELAAMRRKKARQERDEKLLRLYIGPDYAKRVRNRQIQSLQVKLDYARNALEQAKEELENKVSKAAEFEQSGKPIPESLQSAMERLRDEIRAHKNRIQHYKEEIEAIREKFQPIIQRLKVITGGGTSPDTALQAPPSETADTLPEGQAEQAGTREANSTR